MSVETWMGSSNRKKTLGKTEKISIKYGLSYINIGSLVVTVTPCEVVLWIPCTFNHCIPLLSKDKTPPSGIPSDKISLVFQLQHLKRITF